MAIHYTWNGTDTTSNSYQRTVQAYTTEDARKCAMHILDHLPIQDLVDFTRLLNGDGRNFFMTVIRVLESGEIIRREGSKVVAGRRHPRL